MTSFTSSTDAHSLNKKLKDVERTQLEGTFAGNSPRSNNLPVETVSPSLDRQQPYYSSNLTDSVRCRSQEQSKDYTQPIVTISKSDFSKLLKLQEMSYVEDPCSLKSVLRYTCMSCGALAILFWIFMEFGTSYDQYLA